MLYNKCLKCGKELSLEISMKIGLGEVGRMKIKNDAVTVK